MGYEFTLDRGEGLYSVQQFLLEKRDFGLIESPHGGMPSFEGDSVFIFETYASTFFTVILSRIKEIARRVPLQVRYVVYPMRCSFIIPETMYLWVDLQVVPIQPKYMLSYEVTSHA